MKRPLFLLFSSLFSLGLSASAFAASFTPLGDLAGPGINSQAFGISADGTTVVGRGLSFNGNEAFIWNATGGMQGLGDLGEGFGGSRALGISGDGTTVVGSSRVSPPISFSGGESQAFFWDATNGMQALGDFPEVGDFNEATGVSTDGSTVVGRAGGEAFIWDAINGLQEIGDLAVLPSRGPSISADGSVVAGTGRPLNSAPGTEALIWDETNGIQGLGALSGSAFGSVAQGLSADGTTVVGFSDSALGPQAFVWDAITGMQGLGDLAGGIFQSQAFAASADGTTVVGTGTSASGSLGEAFVWDATNGMQSLQVLLASLGLDLSGWQLEQATGISANGNMIVGFGTNPAGFQEAFLADLSAIPEPGTALLLGFGLVGLCARRRSSLV